MSSGRLHGRDLTDDAFYEWLLSDHPDARAERDSRRAATYHAELEQAGYVTNTITYPSYWALWKALSSADEASAAADAKAIEQSDLP